MFRALVQYSARDLYKEFEADVREGGCELARLPHSIHIEPQRADTKPPPFPRGQPSGPRGIIGCREVGGVGFGIKVRRYDYIPVLPSPLLNGFTSWWMQQPLLPIGL